MLEKEEGSYLIEDFDSRVGRGAFLGRLTTRSLIDALESDDASSEVNSKTIIRWLVVKSYWKSEHQVCLMNEEQDTWQLLNYCSSRMRRASCRATR